MCVRLYIYIHTHMCVRLYICTLNLCPLWIIYKILNPAIYDNKHLKRKLTKFGFAEEKYLITDIILQYWSMGMVIKAEPAFTWFYSCNKTLHGQCPQLLPALDVGHSPCLAFGRDCSILNSLVKTGLINIGFVTSKNTIIFLPFFPPSSPLFLSFSFLLYNC